ncbi:hypothetical protein CDD83_210 [Cordyceps sp. RAO-2017]|nr:hypothetical protein CDD83_210 [Cordyceps sp. RAO-2017]
MGRRIVRFSLVSLETGRINQSLTGGLVIGRAADFISLCPVWGRVLIRSTDVASPVPVVQAASTTCHSRPSSPASAVRLDAVRLPPPSLREAPPVPAVPPLRDSDQLDLDHFSATCSPSYDSSSHLCCFSDSSASSASCSASPSAVAETRPIAPVRATPFAGPALRGRVRAMRRPPEPGVSLSRMDEGQGTEPFLSPAHASEER